MKKWLLFFLSLGLVFGIFDIAFSKEKLEINFFYSETCPHCAAEQKFLDGIEKKYPEAQVNRYDISNPRSQNLLKELAKKYGAERYIGLAPLTFVGENFFLGFESPEGTGEKIEESILRQVQELEEPSRPDETKVTFPIIGEIDISRFSLPVLAVIFGFFDGFDICSLSALVLVLSIVLVFRSRLKILFFGGIFILINAITYGFLIILWSRIFSFVGSFLRNMEILIGILAIGGGIYFLRRFWKIRKTGPVCEMETGWGKGIISKSAQKIRELFETGKVLSIILGFVIFDIVISFIEFPCSGALPVIFASILNEAGLGSTQYLLYLTIFLFFYLIDELIVFLVAVFTMKIWISSPKFVTWSNFAIALILFLLGFYYLLSF